MMLTNLIQTLNYAFQTGDPAKTVTYTPSAESLYIQYTVYGWFIVRIKYTWLLCAVWRKSVCAIISLLTVYEMTNYNDWQDESSTRKPPDAKYAVENLVLN